MRAIFCLLFALLVSCATSETRAPSASAIEQAVQGWGAAYDSRDPARITSLYAPDAVLLGTSSPLLRDSPAAIADYFKAAPTRPQARVKIDKQHVWLSPDLAVSTGFYTFSDERDGKATTTPARFTMAFRREGDRWLIVHHHSSRLPAP